MAQEEDSGSAQSQQIDTSQPTPLRGLKIRGVKATPEILCVREGAGKDGEDVFYKVAAANFDSKVDTKAPEEKLPTRKKAKKKAKKKVVDDE